MANKYPYDAKLTSLQKTKTGFYLGFEVKQNNGRMISFSNLRVEGTATSSNISNFIENHVERYNSTASLDNKIVNPQSKNSSSRGAGSTSTSNT